MLISAVCGSENFPNGSCKYHLFFVPTRQRMGKEAHISQLAKGLNPDVPVSQTQVRKFAAMTGYPETLGYWIQSMYDVPEGVVLKVFGTKRETVQRQQLPARTAAIYIQLRSSAPLQRISGATLRDPKGQLQSATFEGRFDILTLREMAALGIGVNTMTMNQIAPGAVQRLFEITTLDRALQERTVVKQTIIRNAEGETVSVAKATTRRAVKL